MPISAQMSRFTVITGIFFIIRLSKWGMSAYPDGAFYLFVKSPEPDANAFSERAKKHGASYRTGR